MRRIAYVVLLAGLGLLTGCTSAKVGGADTVSADRLEPAGNTRTGTASDASITAAVKAAFQRDELLNAANIDVVTNQGVVSLSGRLPSGRAANRALSLARDTEGVRRVLWSDLQLTP